MSRNNINIWQVDDTDRYKDNKRSGYSYDYKSEPQKFRGLRRSFSSSEHIPSHYRAPSELGERSHNPSSYRPKPQRGREHIRAPYLDGFERKASRDGTHMNGGRDVRRLLSEKGNRGKWKTRHFIVGGIILALIIIVGLALSLGLGLGLDDNKKSGKLIYISYIYDWLKYTCFMH